MPDRTSNWFRSLYLYANKLLSAVSDVVSGNMDFAELHQLNHERADVGRARRIRMSLCHFLIGRDYIVM